MDDNYKNRYQLLFQDTTFAEALSSIGFFATHYPTGESIVSDLWTTQGLGSEEFGKDFR